MRDPAHPQHQVPEHPTSALGRAAAKRVARPSLFGLALGLGLSPACGSRSNEDVPPALLQAIEQAGGPAGGQSAAGYPEGPYGTRVGDVAKDLCVVGWHDPRAEGYEPEAAREICFSDFHDPTGAEHRLLVVNTSAIWCGACATEYGGNVGSPKLAEEIAARRAAGLRALGTIFQDIERRPAGIDEAALWTRRFEVDFPFGVDEPFAMGDYADPVLQPFNLVLDTRTMEIVLAVEGFEPETLWPVIDSLLER